MDITGRYHCRGGTWQVGAARIAALALLAACAASGGGTAHASDVVLAQGVQDLVAQAESVTIADLVSAQARRNGRGNLIVTDYRFRTVQSVLGLAPQEFVLTQGGGTLAGETHAISDAPPLRVGERYLMFVRPGRGEMFPPFVGGAQGVYRLSPDGSATALGGAREQQPGDALLAQVQALLQQRGTAAPRAPSRVTMPAGSYPQKAYLPAALTPRPAAGRAPAIDPAIALDAPDSGATGATQAGPAAEAPQTDGPGLDYVYQHRITPPAVINGFPHDWTPWHPEEEYQMFRWNQFGGDVLRVYATPTGNWAWENDRFDPPAGPTTRR
ncbi:MAG TPA: hypothetical protein VIZ64_07110 [Dokdonella sp.]